MLLLYCVIIVKCKRIKMANCYHFEGLGKITYIHHIYSPNLKSTTPLDSQCLHKLYTKKSMRLDTFLVKQSYEC